MKILITGGGCEEPIDNVRSICNFSTGRTSTEIANTLIDSFKSNIDVTAIMAEKAVKPKNCNIKTFKTFQQLEDLIKKECSSEIYDVIIHAAAVSDYSPEYVIIDEIKYKIGEIPKISSQNSLQIVMKKNPKILNNIKNWTENSCKLIGFKLTSNATEEERNIAVNKLFSEENSPDYVIANDLSEITETEHPFYIYSKMGLIKKVFTVKELINIII